MAGTTLVDIIRLGDSATAANNFVLQTNGDGSFKLARGNVGETTQDIITVDAAGNVKIPGTRVPAFSAYQSVAQSLVSSTMTKVTCTSVEFDTDGCYSTTTSRFTPTVAGAYQVSGSVQPTTPAALLLHVFKNGVVAKMLTYSVAVVGAAEGSALVYMNGTTDYLELHVQQYAATQNTVAAAHVTYFQACLVRAA